MSGPSRGGALLAIGSASLGSRGMGGSLVRTLHEVPIEVVGDWGAPRSPENRSGTSTT